LRGYIIYHVVPDEAVIVNFAIAPEFWQQGLGAQLLEHTLNIMQESGISAVYLDVRRSNLAALVLYAKYGFRTLGERKNYYSEPVEDALVMVRHTHG
jgi:ribosomal-protein-alanine N-acetyltransferase